MTFFILLLVDPMQEMKKKKKEKKLIRAININLNIRKIIKNLYLLNCLFQNIPFHSHFASKR